MVSIPVTLEQLITAVQQLSPQEKALVAQTLLQDDLQADLAALLAELYAQPPVESISDDDILAEVNVVRQRA